MQTQHHPETRIQFREQCEALRKRGYVPTYTKNEDSSDVRNGIAKAFVEFTPATEVATFSRCTGLDFQVRVYAPEVAR